MRRFLAPLLASVAVPAFAQTATPPAAPAEPSAAEQPADPIDDIYDGDGEVDEAVTVVAGPPRGSVIGDIPPESSLDARDIRATGATSIEELLEALEPQIGSARGRDAGGRPVMLLNGRRISGFRELRDIPPEAIERVDILPEEVALKYGYRADQKVVNFVLRRRFHSTVARADGVIATDGGYEGGLGDVTRLSINRDRRTTINFHAEANGRLDEDEREIDLQDPAGFDERPFRSLVGSRQLARASATVNRTILGDVSATLNGEYEHSEGRSGLGFEEVPLLRDSTSDSAHLGLSLNQDRGLWKTSLTGNADWTHNVTSSDRDADTTDRSRSTTTSGDLTGTFSGPIATLPAGRANVTAKLAVSTLDLDASRRRNGVTAAPTDLGRDVVDGALNLDVPLLRNSPVGRLSANANAEVEHFSDFGTLTTVGAGLNWQPVPRLNLIASWTREEGVPSIQQLGDPILETADTRVFDFTTGETVLVTATTGGNPDLDADRRNVFKLGGNWKPFAETDLRLRVDFVHSVIKDPVGSFPGPSAELEAAFRDRFVRDDDDNLVSVDLRPVNFEESRRDTLRWGFDFSKPLRSARPSQAQIEQMRARFAPPGGRTLQGGQNPEGAPPEGGRPDEGAQRADGNQGPDVRRGGGGGGRRGGFFGGGGGRNRGRLSFSLTHSINLVDEATIADGFKLDYLNGDAVNNFGGRPRHEVQVRAGWSNNGLGARLSGNWRSGTRVEGGENGDLRFSPLATVDLRLFANLGERFELVSKHPWLIGSSVRLEIDNLLDSKPEVRDAFGEVPFSYQQDLLEPRGRTVTLSFRKMFLPQRFRQRSSASSTTR